MQVVVCGAVPSMVVRSVRLYSQCSHMYVNVFPNGTVMARSDGNDQLKNDLKIMTVLMKKLMECSSTEFGQLYSPDTLQRLPPNTA
ncbi:hypothetical protein SFRURICE_000322 [Spodoptera frugiperda]|uniref:SFRICE_034083 n=1 Tax=Spodoptera frugiperda TaxID=7108 RepID=A0A2H1V6T8_SPOFR|nr:hypothetical protein SFRURICE_000322 [Spodoptera frugiperda]